MVLQQASEVKKPLNFYEEDKTLQTILKESLSPEFYLYAHKELTKFGSLVANEIDERAKYTDRDGQPRLQKFNKYGDDVSEIWVNEGYKKTVKETYRTGIVGYVHKEIPELGHKGNYLYSFAQGYLLSQAEPGFYCPVTLTQATAYLLEHYASDDVKDMFSPHVCATVDTELFEGATFLTERQGGSDVGANIVKAVADGEQYRLYGEKYFASNVGMCGVAMVLARMEGAVEGSRGLSLFAVPWRQEDGSLNGIQIRRLKDKLGVRAVPSGEVEFDGALAYLIGDSTKGFYYMMEALNLSRICNAVASLGIMRRALNEATTYADRRNAFGKKLTEFPMVQETLSTMKAKLEVEMATTFDMIKLYDKVTSGNATNDEIVLNRLKIALLKKETAEQAIHFSHEAIEMHGGNGYIEDFVTPRLLRDAQVLTVWEGTANILGMELVRLVNKFDAHTLFIEEMKERINGVPDSNWKENMSSALKKVTSDLESFASLEPELQTIEAKKLMRDMTLTYEGVVALEWANQQGGRYEKMMEIFIETNWIERAIGDEKKSVKYFEQII
ncbi:acyl-CoA dehydrogenase family protein [Sporosarcina sp. Marseille-Q4063]|uniref:acyl-CoA dehydrogenase family protein n=1 Tax=Sporosarcina sp. Marseille-Q4063 TaxID=2810514 RepID=UPI001BAED6D0|nr:acyl-CoA dehydrogenase family protein [Sporosarcina sp. Marseille-Q4063]QUW23118.1 acyl-CoA dehydrogenase family protein [Sporosarcina sp. Marseille-Q4063]